MNTVMVWLLIAVSNGGNSVGTTNVVATFKTKEMCLYVEKNIPSTFVKTKCIQAEIIKGEK